YTTLFRSVFTSRIVGRQRLYCECGEVSQVGTIQELPFAIAVDKDDSTNVTTPAPAKATPIVALSFLVLEGNLVPVLLVSPDRDHSGACDCKQLAAVCAVTFGDICVLPHPARARRKADTLFLILLQR